MCFTVRFDQYLNKPEIKAVVILKRSEDSLENRFLKEEGAYEARFQQ